MKESKSKDKRITGKADKKPVDAADPDEADDKVTLKPFMGIRPGVYLTIIYSFILLLIIFLVLFLPGIRNTGSVLIVKTEPRGAAIRVDDVYMGISVGRSSESTAGNLGSRIFLKNGSYLIEAVMPGFETQAVRHTINGRVFASLFAPRREYIEVSLKTSNPQAAFAHYAADFASWSFGGEPTATWQIPMSLSEGAYRTGSYENAAEDLQDILQAASRFTITRAALRDLLRAKLLLDNLGNSPSPVTLINSLSEIILFLSENPGSAEWLSGLFPVNSPVYNAIISSEWYKTDSSQHTIQGITENTNVPNIEIQGQIFSYIQPVTIVSSEIIDNEGFFISQTPVSQSLFETFLNENPQWNDHYTIYSGQEINTNPIIAVKGEVITGITWYAAEAFCKWLTGFLPASLSNMEIRLPTEDEWSFAALSVSNMRTPGWEWCADPYAPLTFISVEPEAVNILGSPEKLLRGRQSLTSTETRTSLPPDISSPIVTFRPVIARH